MSREGTHFAEFAVGEDQLSQSTQVLNCLILISLDCSCRNGTGIDILDLGSGGRDIDRLRRIEELLDQLIAVLSVDDVFDSANDVLLE